MNYERKNLFSIRPPKNFFRLVRPLGWRFYRHQQTPPLFLPPANLTLYCQLLTRVSNKNDITTALTKGLLAGYGGQTEFTTVNRGSFTLKSSHYQDKDMVYHDEWTNGGGQEIIRFNNETFTRVYAGGVNDKKVSADLIIQKLIYFIKQLGNKTRLFSNTKTSDGDWKYQYKILDQDQDLDITVGKETITFQNQIVFIHVFVLSRVV